MLGKTLGCSKCGKQTPMNEIRADLNAKSWVCLSCYEQLSKKSKRLETGKNILANEYLKETTKKIVPLKKTFVCFKCSYQFLGYLDSINKKCPFCGRSGTVKEGISSSAILSEVEEESRNYKKY